MPLFKRQLASLFGGVSQQPDVARSLNQSEEDLNAWASVVDGVGKRQPFEHVAQLSNVPLTGAHVHTVNRDVTERYTVILTDGDLQVFKIDGTPATVYFPAGKAYLGASDPEADFRLVSVADYTFIVNTGKQVGMLAAGADTLTQPDYYYWLNKDSGQPVAQKLQYEPNPVAAAWTGTVQTVQDLPDTPANGDVYQVSGYTGNVVEWVLRNGAVWQECYKPGIANAMDPLSLPHALVRAPDGTFTFAPFSWAPRRVGDTTSNPNPTFVGRNIRDVFFWRNRLCFTTDENVVMSRSSDFGNFYRMTVTQVLPDDVIDIATSETSVSLLNYAVPFRDSLLLFADQTQFALTVNGSLTAGSVAVTPITHYRMSKSVRPVPSGEEAYFASEPYAGETGSGHTLIHNYYVEPTNNALNTSDDITAHVPRLIPAGVRALAASAEYDTVFALTRGEPANIYVYKSFWRDGRKVQSAWTPWSLEPSATVLSVAILDDYAYFVVSRAHGTSLERLALTSKVAPDAMPFNVLVDRRAKVQGTYLAVSDTTEFSLPWQPENASVVQLIAGDAFGNKMGTLLSSYNWTAPTVLRVPGRWDAGPVYAGVIYTFRHTFSKAYFLNPAGVAVTTGRLMLRSYTVNFTDTGYFKTSVSAYPGDNNAETVIPPLLDEFTGRTLGDAALQLGTPALASGSYTFMVLGDGAHSVVSLENTSHVPCLFNSAEYEGLYATRSQVM